VTESQNEILHKYNLETLPGVIQKLIDFSNKGNKQEHTACRLLAPRLVTSLGSMMSSSSISLSGSISHQALTWFSLGLKSKDVSGRLKLASMYFCAGDMGQTEVTLKHISQQYNNSVLVPLCGCCDCSLPKPNSIFLPLFSEQNVASFQNYISHCVRFTQSEKNCVPHELQFEMFRSTQEDRQQHRNEDKDYWMSWAVVDSLPFLYFLQYKVYSRLKKRHNQQEALNDLIWIIETNENLSHKETDLNLLGQVMEQENRPKDALKYFRLSLQIRPRNNAASILFCKVLATKIFK
jgi:tetratricopeptide (TPR) repeat protein